MLFQRDCADRCAPSTAGDRVCFGNPWKWFGSLDLLLPHEAVEEQHGVTLQPGSGWLSAQHGSAFPCQLLHLWAQLEVWKRLLQHLPLHVGNEPQWKYHLLDGYRCGQVHACGASPSSHQLFECTQSHVWSTWAMDAQHLNVSSRLHFETQHNLLRELHGRDWTQT